MLKPGLGKGLGDLMHGDQVAGTKPPLNNTPAALPEFGRGMSSLIRADPLAIPSAKRHILPPWFYFAADLLLLGYAVAITFDAPRPFNTGTMIFCIVSVGLGGVLAILGTLQTVSTSTDSHRNDARNV